jgi:cation diffusion facilitator family transporter
MSDSRTRSTWTVLLAGGANLAIAVAKLVAGVVTGSSAMLSEAAHSFADTLNQAFLMAALRRSRRPADAEHPFGYGKERYFWSLRAAVAVFVLGAGFSAFQGVDALVRGHAESSPVMAYVVLAAALLFDGSSLVRGLWQVRKESAEQGQSVRRQLLQAAEPTVRAVVFEDFAAVVGVLLAAIGLAVDQVTGSHVADAVASLAIALLLVGVAYALGRQNEELLIGRAAPPDLLEDIRLELAATPGIRSVVEMLTMQLGPDEVLVAARVEVDPGAPGRDLERVADEADGRVRTAYPQVAHVFLDPTPRRS